MKYRALAGITTTIAVASSLAMAAPAYAWHPKGAIVKKVQNITAQSKVADANTEAEAVAAKTGDILEYTITVRNDGAADSRGWNDMAATKVTDILPTGIEMVGTPTQRIYSADLGTIKPGQSVTKAFRVKVTANSAKYAVITNQACFTGNSTANDNPQKGCDNAVIKVTTPPVTPPVTPQPPVKPPVTPTPTPTPPATPTPTVLPATGFNAAGIAGIVAVVATAGHFLLTKKRQA